MNVLHRVEDTEHGHERVIYLNTSKKDKVYEYIVGNKQINYL